MASSAALFRTFPHSVQPKSPNSSMSALLISLPQAPKSHRLSTSIPALGVRLFSPWTGFKHFGLSFRQKYVKRERRKCGGRVVYASLFGVGAPEALVIGVVALLVFGPKGLAEVARNLGKTLRAFQPTIRELQEVSREFKSTLEREIGLDEVVATTKSTFDSTPSSQSQNPQAKVDPNGTPPTNSSTSSEEPLKASKEQPTAPVLGQQEEATASPKEQFTASVATQQEEATASPEGQLTASVTTQQAEAPATEQQPIVIATEQRAGPVPSSDELPQEAFKGDSEVFQRLPNSTGSLKM